MLDHEEKLIREAKKGVNESFGQLYDHYLPKIYRYVLLKVTQRQDAEDLTHEVFLSAWQKIDSYKSQGFPFSSWLYNIAHNRVIDHYRTKKNHADVDQVDEGFIKVVHALDKELDTAMQLENVVKALRDLTDEQQDVVIMRFMEDLSHREIARAINKSEGAVRLIQYRAIQGLKEQLGGQPSEENKNNGGTIV